jgi:hypothetical protein
MKDRRRRRLGKLLGLPVLAMCGFAIAATLASVGLADITTTDTSSTNSTSTSTSTTTTTTTTTPEGGEGCTPGFWKNNADKKGASQWTATGYVPTQLVSTVFSAAPVGIAGKTLLAGLQEGGGQLDALTRHAIAAVLNAAHPGVDYPLTVAEIVDMVNDAYNGLSDVEDTKDVLAGFNEAGCSISQNA